MFTCLYIWSYIIFQAKIQKHQAFEAEVAAHSNAVVVLDNTGMEMINQAHFAAEIIRRRLGKLITHMHTLHSPPPVLCRTILRKLVLYVCCFLSFCFCYVTCSMNFSFNSCTVFVIPLVLIIWMHMVFQHTCGQMYGAEHFTWSAVTIIELIASSEGKWQSIGLWKGWKLLMCCVFAF